MFQKNSQSSIGQIKRKIKVVFLGDQSVGKTSILTRFIHDKFEESTGPTVGIDFMAKNIQIGKNILRMQLWDTAGQQRFRALIPSYLKDALIAFIVFDLTNQKSLQSLNQWIDLCQNNKKQNSIVILLGNKADLKDEREISQQEIDAKIQQAGLKYFEVSAKSGFHIKDAFQFAGSQFITSSMSNNTQMTLSFSSIFKQKNKNQENLAPVSSQDTKKLNKKAMTNQKQNKQKKNQLSKINSVTLLTTSQKKKKKTCC